MIKKEKIKYVNGGRVKSIEKSMLTDDIVESLAETFSAMGDPTRVKIIYVLAKEELCVGDIAMFLNISSSAVSHQLRLLRNLRLVKHRHTGKIAYYTLDDIHIEKLFAEGLKHIKGI